MAPKVMEKPGTVIIAPQAVAETVKEAKVLRNGEKTQFEQWTIEAVPMYKLTRGPQPGKLFHDKGRGNGYVVSYGATRFYISGDTEGVPEMKALKNIDVAFVCMAAVDDAAGRGGRGGARDVKAFDKALAGSGVEVRLVN